ncbi:hypothetical protein PPTS312_00230 [Pseudomonas putida]|uniref:ABC transmembrane type-1 domain-containing protein n=1 Tax=Pseudomonas putida TaxID=303 RepID=A0A7U6RA59_PSEPU|nr:hypothetical protein PPTS312_00230 [Pseudomonas putida]
MRSFGGEAYEEQRFGKASQSNTDKQLRMTRTGSLYTPMLQLVIYSAMAALMFLVLFLRGDSTLATWLPTPPPPACCPNRSASFRKSARPSRRAWPVQKASSSNWTKNLSWTPVLSRRSAWKGAWKCAT